MYIGKIAGIKIKISYLFLFLMFIMTYFGMLIDGLLMFLVVMIHEMGHIIVAKKKSYDVEGIEILPIGGVATISHSYYNHSADEWYIALAGPLNNILFVIVLTFLGNRIIYSDRLISYNLSLFFFNLLPAYPLDGGRLLRAFLAKEKSIYESTRMVSLLGIFIGFIFIILGFYYININQHGYIYLGILGLFLTVSAIKEFRNTKYLPIKLSYTKEIDSSYIRKGRILMCDEKAVIKDIMAEIETNRELMICVVDKHGEVVDFITEKRIMLAYQKGRGLGTIKELIDDIEI